MKRQIPNRFGYKIIQTLADDRKSRKMINFIEEWDKIEHRCDQLIYEPYNLRSPASFTRFNFFD